MDCPDKIRTLYSGKLGAGFLPLKPRRGEISEIRQQAKLEELLSPLDTVKAAELLASWYHFHERANHQEYRDFYSKIIYCRQLKRDSIDGDTFLELIADRSILFSEYNQAYTPKGYPSLHTLVESYATQVESRSYPQDILDQVLNQAFVPSCAHYNDYKSWQRNLKQLIDARTQREQQITRLNFHFNSFKIAITPLKDSTNLTPLERYLSDLFSSYLKACEVVYAKWYGEIDWKKSPWKAAIHSVYAYLSANDSSSQPGFSAIVFFHLFTQKAQKLSNNSLSKYEFKPIKKRVGALNDPDLAQAKIRMRIQCNIQLYDQLLELFLKFEHPQWDIEQQQQYRQDAKFVFYKYSRFDRYWHYDLRNFWTKYQEDQLRYEPNIGFNYSENYLDGVDFFGNLLRYNINYCMPNNLQWMLSLPDKNYREPLPSVLATFLLAEGLCKVPAKERLISQVQRVVDSPAGEEMLRKYESVYMDNYKKSVVLEDCRQRHNLHVPRQESTLYESKQDTAVQRGVKNVLEYYLRAKLIDAAQETLGEIARYHFNNLCLGEFSYGHNML